MKKSDSKSSMKKSDRVEAWIKLLIVLVSGFILYFWTIFALILAIFNWLYTVILGVRNQWTAEVIELYNSYVYVLFRYVSGVSNERPFPFGEIKPISKFS